jgi:hypothetical protein
VLNPGNSIQFSTRQSRLATAVFAVLAALLLAASFTTTANAAKKKTAKLTISKVTVTGSNISVTGKVKLPTNTAKIRKKTRVAFSLKATVGPTEKFTAKVNSKLKFTAKHTTKLSGGLNLSGRIKIGGKSSGDEVNTVAQVILPTTGPPADLVGTFKISPGVPVANGFAGSYFRMLQPPDGSTYFANPTSPFGDKTYVPLTPGTQGGLSTAAFQDPPTPGFDVTGNSLASKIIQPTNFAGVNFSIVTQAIDAQTALADPLPKITNTNGVLSGQTTAVVAQWNNLSFNQGSPKPNGTSPGLTSAPKGTYDAASKFYTLDWKSLIVGGPFDGFTGVWHLEGTFVPSS